MSQDTGTKRCVLSTRNGVLLQNDALPDDWIIDTGVLVGIEPVSKRLRRHEPTRVPQQRVDAFPRGGFQWVQLPSS